MWLKLGISIGLVGYYKYRFKDKCNVYFFIIKKNYMISKYYVDYFWVGVGEGGRIFIIFVFINININV